MFIAFCIGFVMLFVTAEPFFVTASEADPVTHRLVVNKGLKGFVLFVTAVTAK